MKKAGMLLPVIAGVMWGSAGVFVRTFDQFGFDNQTIIVSRSVTASILLLIGMMIVDRSMFRIELRDFWIFLGCGLMGVVGLNLCYNAAVTKLTLSLAAVLLSLSPIFVMILAAIFLKEKISLRKIGCAVLAVFGCALVSGVFDSGADVKLSVVGVLVGITAAVFYALYSIFAKVATKRNYNVFTTTFYSMSTVTLMLIPFSDWGMIGSFIAVSPVKNISFIVLNALCASILPYILYNVSLAYVDTGRVSILAAGGEPSAAMIFGLIFFAEMPTVLSLCGLAITIIALWLLCRPAKTNATGKEGMKGDGDI